jgi:hypothetical protein
MIGPQQNGSATLGQRRYTIKGLMIVIALSGASVAALVRPSLGWALVLPWLFVTLLLTALLGVVLRRGSRRAFWIGAALFGWAYVAPLAFCKEDFLSPSFSLVQAFTRPLGGTLELLAALSLEDGAHLADLPGALGQVDDQSRLAVVYSTIGLLFARLGGLIACSLSADDRPETDRERTGS